MHLQPGFRFHPTDVELVLYYLKRKIMGKKIKYEAIAEVNIYKHSPWDLPAKSCLKSKDLEWFFFCPREKKYSSGLRVKRATENGYWKTTGKGKTVSCNEKTVGVVKTLIFHLGHAPHGERSDWVMHEYRILDDQLAEAGVQDNYSICKVFKKNGLGPKNGAQYGAPFNEADWTDDDDGDYGDIAENHAISMEAEGPSRTICTPNEEQSTPLGSMFDSGNGLLPILKERPSSSAVTPTSMEAADRTNDEIVRLLASFADEDTLLPVPNGDELNQDNTNGNEKTVLLPSDEVLDMYNGLRDLDSWKTLNHGRLELSGMQNVDYPLDILPEDNSNYIELDDLLPPLYCSNGITGNHISSFCPASASYNHENVQQPHSGTRFAGMDQYAFFANELGVPAILSEGDKSLYTTHMVENLSYQADNALYNLEFLPRKLDNAVYSPQHMERGQGFKKHFSPRGVFLLRREA